MKKLNENFTFGIADLAIIATCFLWGLGTVAVKSVIGDTPETIRVFVFNGIRMPVSSLLLFIWIKCWGGSVKLHREHIPLVIAVSFFGIFMSMATSLIGLSMSTASNMGIIFSTIPFFILIVSFVSGIERPTASLIMGIFVGMTGVLIISYEGGKITYNPGDLLILLSCLFWAYYTVYGKKIMNSYSPPVATAWVFLFASLFQLPFMLYQLPGQTWSTLSFTTWMQFGYATFGSYFVAFALFYFALHKIGPIRTGLYSNLEPVFTLLFANILLGEHISLLKIAGFIVILFGIGITKIPARAKPV